METKKPQANDDSSKADTTAAKTNGDVKSTAVEEQLTDFVVIDELSLSSNKNANVDNANDKKPINESAPAPVDNNSEESKNTAANDVKDTSKNDANEKDNEKNCDSLILTADEDLEPAVSSPKKSTTESVTTEAEESKQNPSDSTVSNAAPTENSEMPKAASEKVPPSKNQRVIWVSNISKTIKATDLKQYLSKAGKVTTAKIVTDGKRCFGYVLMENANDASECVKTLNDTNFDGKNIQLSFNKPTKVGSKATPNDSHSSDPKKTTKEGSQHDSKRPEKRPRSSSKHSVDRSKRQSSSKSKHTSPSAAATKSTEKKVPDRSRSRERRIRERNEREALKRRLMLEERKNREARQRQIEMEERQREKEFKLEQERRKLQMEREFFEKQKREWARINEERRKLDRARMEVEQQRAKLEEDLKKDRLKRKSPDMIPSSIVSKLSESSKRGSKSSKRDDYKSAYECSAPLPPKLVMDFDHGDRKTSDRKADRVGGRKIEVIDRKFYGESADPKKHYSRKSDFEESKPYLKRYPSERDGEHRTQWSPPIAYGSGVGSSTPRYQESIPTQPFAGGTSRGSGYYYHPSASTQEFPRYDQLSSRKY